VAFLMVAWGVLRLFSGDFLNGLWIMSIGWFLRNAAIASYRQLIVRDAMGEVLVSRLMRDEFVAVSPDLTLADFVDNYVIRRSDHSYPVLESDRLVGIVCLHDVRKVSRPEWLTTTVRQAMTPGPQLLVVKPRDDGNTILSRMAQKDVHQLPVVDGERLVGMVSRGDLVRFLQWQTEVGMYA
jgi:CBS domain-containing protein